MLTQQRLSCKKYKKYRKEAVTVSVFLLCPLLPEEYNENVEFILESLRLHCFEWRTITQQKINTMQEYNVCV